MPLRFKNEEELKEMKVKWFSIVAIVAIIAYVFLAMTWPEASADTSSDARVEAIYKVMDKQAKAMEEIADTLKRIERKMK